MEFYAFDGNVRVLVWTNEGVEFWIMDLCLSFSSFFRITLIFHWLVTILLVFWLNFVFTSITYLSFWIFADWFCWAVISQLTCVLVLLNFGGGVRMHIAVVRNKYQKVKELRKINMSIGSIAFYQLMKVCQVSVFYNVLVHNHHSIYGFPLQSYILHGTYLTLDRYSSVK